MTTDYRYCRYRELVADYYDEQNSSTKSSRAELNFIMVEICLENQSLPLTSSPKTLFHATLANPWMI